MASQPSLFDVCARKHGGNQNSRAANLRIHPHKESDREAIRIQVAAMGFAGLTLKEIRIIHPTAQPERWKYPNEISGRITALKALGQIFDSGRERGNCTVWVARQEWVNA